MAEQRAVRGNEGRGIAIAVAAHVLIIGLLSVQWTGGDRRFDNPPMEVDLIAETAVQSTAPIITEAPPSARLGEEDAVDIAAPEPIPTPPVPEPIVRQTPSPTPKQVARPVPTPPKKAAACGYKSGAQGGAENAARKKRRKRVPQGGSMGSPKAWGASKPRRRRTRARPPRRLRQRSDGRLTSASRPRSVRDGTAAT